jgi:hypothetical protein
MPSGTNPPRSATILSGAKPEDSPLAQPVKVASRNTPAVTRVFIIYSRMLIA